ncbi:MAG: hypothetical protein H5T34_05265, partial [Candidatus Methanomethyliales bacterium]|nr:hypothetical protein [Candidatus Methanomethylicales archaeon]
MKVIVDGTEMEAHENECLGEFFNRVGIKIKEGHLVSVKRKIEVERISTNLYEVQTSRGKMILRWECVQELNRWKQTYRNFEGCSVRWATIDAVVFGP